MKKTTRILIWAVAATMLFACRKKEDPKPDLTNAEIEFQGLTENQELFGNVMLKAQLGKEVELDKITFYINETKVAEDAESPFEVEWNSRQVDDGTHTLKMIGEFQGVTKEVTLPVSVNNLLASFQVNLYAEFFEYYDFYVFLSDSEGKMIGNHLPLGQDSKAEIRRPDGFEGENFHLNLIAAMKITEDGGYGFMMTYQDVSPGELKLHVPGFEFTYSGDATIRVANLPEGTESNMYFSGTEAWGGGYSSGFDEENNALYEVSFYGKSTERLLAKFDDYDFFTGTDNSLFYFTEEVSANGDMKIDYNNFVKAQYKEGTSPGPDYFDYYVEGYLNDMDGYYFIGGTSSGTSDNSTLKLPYLDSFDGFRTIKEVFTDDNKYYYQVNYGPEVHTSLDKLSFYPNLMSEQDGELQMELTGDYDVYELYLGYFLTEGELEYEFEWIVYSDRTNQKLKFPELPDELTSKYPKLFSQKPKLSYVSYYDLENWSDRNDFHENAFNKGLGLNLEEVVYLFSTSNKTGYREASYGYGEESSSRARKTRNPFVQNEPMRKRLSLREKMAKKQGR
jgi:hypothetical protein